MAYSVKSKKKGAQKPAVGNKSVELPGGGAETDTEHGKLIGWVNDADDATIDCRNLAEKSRSYYDSEQWTDAEKTKLAAQKQAATVINRIKPKIDSLSGMERANRTTAKAYPRTPKHTAGATAATEAVRFCLEDNFYSRKRSDAWENMTVEGTGALEICVKPKDEGYKVIIRHIMWDRIIYDPHSRRKDFSDARFLGQVVWMDYDEAIAQYPEAADVLETMQTGSSTYDDKPRWMDNTRRRVKIVELYYQRDDGEWWYACFTLGGYCKRPMKSPYVNEEGETEHAYEFGSLFVDREGNRYGAIKQLLDIQDEINKRRSKALHLLSVRQTYGTAGTVADLQKAKNELSKPDGHVEFAYGEMGKDFGVLPTGDMAAAQFNLLTEAKMEMDSVGANAATMGKDKSVQSGVALRQRAMTGQTELAPMFDMLKNLDIRVYRKVWNRIKQYWKAEMWLRVTDDENNLKFVGLNKPVTKGEQMLKELTEHLQSRGLPPEQIKQQIAQIQRQMENDPSMKEVVDTENDIVNLDVDIVMDDAPDTVTQEVEDFQAMAEMVKSGFPLPPEAVIMASPLSNKDKIIKMMKEKPQIPPEIQQQMQGMQEQMQKMQEEYKKLAQENQALKQDTQSEQMKIAADAKSESDKAILKQQQMLKEFELKEMAQNKEYELARSKAIKEFELKREMAILEASLASDVDVELAIGRITNIAISHQTKMKGILDAESASREAEVEQRGSMESEARAGQMNDQFLQAVNQIVTTLKEGLAQKKSVTLGGIQRNSDGVLVGASATVNTLVPANIDGT